MADGRVRRGGSERRGSIRTQRFLVKAQERQYIGTSKQIVYWLYKADFMNTEGKADYMWEVTERLSATGVHINYDPAGYTEFLRALAKNELIELKEV